MRNSYDFKFGDFWLSELGGMMTESPTIEIAQRDINFIDIPGKDGKDLVDNGRYDNVEFSRSIAFVSKPLMDANSKVNLAINNYAYLQGYQDFEDTDHDGLITKAVLTNFDSVNKELRSLRTAKLKFSRLPYWYRKDSFDEIIIANMYGGSTTYLRNPYKSDAKSIIRFYFGCSSTTFVTESLEFTIFGKKVYRLFVDDLSINKDYKILEIDLDKQIACQINADGDIHHYYDYILPTGIDSGENTFLTGSNSNLLRATIIPKWRCL